MNFFEKLCAKLEEPQSMECEYEMAFDINNKMNFKCKVCSKFCNSLEQFNIHKLSQKHIKNANTFKSINMNKATITPSKPVNTCEICKISCNTNEQLFDHYNGQSHIKKAKKNGYEDQNELAPFFKDPLNNNNYVDSYKIEIKTPITSFGKKRTHEFLDNIQSTSTEVNDNIKPKKAHTSIECQLCNKSIDTYEQYLVHCKDAQHLLKELPVSIENEPDEQMCMKLGDKSLEYCAICQITIHSNNVANHYNGKQHKEKILKTTSSTDFSVGYPKKTNLSAMSTNFNDLKLIPRNYQNEVYEKSLNKDSVIFLPTGTGKTVVASMLMLKMLEENPFHRMAFIVDKVLLVMQQHDFFKNQFENISMNRFKEDGSLTNRKLRLVGLANNYVNTEYAVSVREHDIVVATAELFRGLLVDQKLFWQEFCLVILDEAHHCAKDHPYNKLLKEYHLYPEHVLVHKANLHKQLLKGSPKVNGKKYTDWTHRRCKMIGLTASPAGDLDKDNTFILLIDLLESMGGVDIVNVTENIEELELFTSTSNIETKLVEYTKEEAHIREIMKSVFLSFLQKMKLFIYEINYISISRDHRKFRSSDVSYFKRSLQDFLQISEEVHKMAVKQMISILDIIIAIDTFGYEVAWRRLNIFLDDENEKVWLDINTTLMSEQLKEIAEDSSEKVSSLVQTILEEAKSVDGDSRTVLVLVKERDTAHQLESFLKKKSIDQQSILLVGHGTTSTKTDKIKNGMTVGKQKKALNLIKGRSNQIIVATSVADEGIDLPQCDLVILINPPSSVQALVQIRGRARMKASRLLMLCRDKKSIEKLKHLQVKEKNIVDSIDRILRHGKSDCFGTF